MPFNGSGVYTPPGADFPAVTQTVISSTHYNNVVNDLATGLSLCLTKDGQQVATGNIPFGGFRATNVGITAIAGTVGTPAINVSDAGTGLYRSAVSELAVTCAGAQVARFASTGLIVTGAISASTSVITPLVTTAAATSLTLDSDGGTGSWLIETATKHLRPFVVQDNLVNLGAPTSRIKQLFTPIIDSGTTGSLSFKLNNGETALQLIRTGVATNFFTIEGTASGAPVIRSAGADTDITIVYGAKGAGNHQWNTGPGLVQLQVLNAAGANRNITITGSNGGNPTIGVTGGSLAITPAVVVAGASLQVGTNPAGQNGLNCAYNTGVWSRNQLNNGDNVLALLETLNSVTNVLQLGDGAMNGTFWKARSGGAAPNTTDLPSGFATVWRDTGGATTKLYYNNGGAIQSVALS